MKKIMVYVLVLTMLILVVGCSSLNHGININTPKRVSWGGELQGLHVDGVSVLINRNNGSTYVIIRGYIENTNTHKTFHDLSIGAELITQDGRLGGGTHLRGPNTVFNLSSGEQKSFEIRINDPAKGRYDIIFNLRGGAS